MTSEYDQLLIYAEELGGPYHTVRKQYRQLARLHQASEMLQQSIRLDEVAATALQQMSGLYQCRAAIALLLPELEELRAFVINEPDGPIERIVGSITPAYTSRLKRALGKDRKAKDLSRVWPPAVDSQVTAAQLDGLRAAATFHLGRNRLGFLCLPDGDAQIDTEYVRAFADQVSLAVQNALLYDDLQRKATETEILLESVRHLGESLSINKILQSLSELTAKYILSREGAVAIALPSPSREVVLAGTIRHKDGTMTPLSLSLLKNGGPDGASNPTRMARDLERVQELLDDRLFGVQGSQIWREPVAAGDQQGELMVLAPEGEPLNPTEQRLMKAIASHAEVALSHAVLYSRERSHAAYLTQQQDKRVEYLQQMAHELKTPLTAIRPLLEVAASLPSGHDPERMAEILKIMTRGVTRLEGLTNRYLQGFDAPGMPERLLAFEVTDLAALIAEVVELEQASFRGSSQRVHFDSKVGEAVALVDPLAVEEVVTNLLSNCRKYAGPGADVEVTLSEERGKGFVVTVSDSGAGIPGTHLRRIRRAIDDPGAEHMSPPCRGLRISARLVELHGGKMWVRSREGKGTTVGFSLAVE